jgi:DNA-binding transcriptional LysR family regulator
MELYQLEDFVAVVEEHSFTRAAERVCRTQGAVSVAIRKLEEEVGVPLIVRDTHDCALTSAGRELLAYARGMIDLRDKMTRSMSDYRNLAAGRVSIAAHESAAEYLLRAPLAAFHKRYPAIRLEARLCDGPDIARLVFEREVDLGFGIHQASLHGLRSEMVHTDPLVLIAAPTHRLSRCERVSITELGGEHFYIHSRRTPITMTTQALFADHHVPLNVAAALWNFEAMKQFVKTGDGLAIVPASVAHADATAGRLAALSVDELVISRTIEVIRRDNEIPLPAPAALLHLLRTWEWGGEPAANGTPVADSAAV